MKHHTSVYMRYFGYQIAEDAICEVCFNRCVDIHHVFGRGKGKDVIENLIGLCRQCHIDAHNEKITKDQLNKIHQKFINENS